MAEPYPPSLWGEPPFVGPKWKKPTLRNLLGLLGRWRITHRLVLITFSVHATERYAARGWEQDANGWHGQFTYATRAGEIYERTLEFARSQGGEEGALRGFGDNRGYDDMTEWTAQLGREYSVNGIIAVDGFTLSASSEEGGLLG